jgi:hypothetical protein
MKTTKIKATPMYVIEKNFGGQEIRSPFVVRHFHHPAEAMLIDRNLDTAMLAVYFVKDFLDRRRSKNDEMAPKNFLRYIKNRSNQILYATKNMTYSSEFRFADQEYFCLIAKAEDFVRFHEDMILMYGGGSYGQKMAWYLMLKIFLFDESERIGA